MEVEVEVVEVLSPGSRYNREEDKIEIVEEMVESDKEVPGDKRTFEVVREVGDSLEEMIKLTADVPSNYTGGRVPILDMEVWVERDESGMSKIRWGFYEKKMKSRYVMMRDSAVGMKTKRRTLVQEVVRRMRNSDRETELEEVGEVLSKFCQKMRDSGYEEKMRREIL